jgi:DNA polymerase III subunit epsilon
MNSRRYVICDIEATGLDQDKDLIEIALITYQEGKLVDVYDTHINPLRPVSEFIQQLTSISQRELEVAPKFYEVADAIRMRLEGAVFVSHNTDFDYQLLRQKYQQMGQELKLKTFCTLKMTQTIIPGLKNYNLDALCNFFGIKIQDRHSALGDARATLELFRQLEGLCLKERELPKYLPAHEKLLKRIPAQAGVISFIDEDGRCFKRVATENMLQSAREHLLIKPANREWLQQTDQLRTEVTGSVLIAEFRLLQLAPYHAHWMITAEERRGEKYLQLRRYRKSQDGIYYFATFWEAKKKLQELEKKLKGEKYIYRDSPVSKEEILKKNQKIDALIKQTAFPVNHLVLLGEGRRPGEKSLVLVQNGHVQGYGFTDASAEEIYQNPEKHLEWRFSHHLGADLAAKRHLRILKHLRHKSEGWRSLSMR